MGADEHRSDTVIRELEASISRLELRLTRVEEALSLSGAERSSPREAPDKPRKVPARPPHPEDRTPVSLVVSMIGRSLIVIGGAYLLRALTESGAFPILVGAIAGLSYTSIFIVQSYRQGAESPLSATFHAATATLIAMPLAVETATRFGAMRPELSFLIILGIGGIVGVISVRFRMKALAWIVQCISLASLVALIIGAHRFSLGMISLLVLSVGSVALANRLDNRFLVLLPALFCSILVVPLVDSSISDRALPDAPAGITTILVYLATWCGIVMIDARRRSDRPGPLLLSHLAVVTLLGVGGSFFVAYRTGHELLFATISSLIAIATGTWAIRMMIGAGDRDRRSVTFVTLTSVLIMAITASLLEPAIVAILWLSLAVTSFLLARFGHRLLYEPVILLTLGAAFMSGLAAWIAETLISLPSPARALPSISGILAILAAVTFLMRADPPNGWRGFHRWAINVTMSVIVVGSWIALAVHLIQLALPWAGSEASDTGAVAAARVIVLSITAIVMAWLARYPRSRTFASLVNIILVLTAILIILVNVRVGRAATHFPAFSAYGIALIVAPAVKRKSLSIRNRSGERSSISYESEKAATVDEPVRRPDQTAALPE